MTSIKFKLKFIEGQSVSYSVISKLNSWRKVLRLASLIGYNERYGYYGNVSQLLPPFDLPNHKKNFVITGTQTGGVPDLDENGYCVVTEYVPSQNLVAGKGKVKPSSEALTHGVIYDLAPEARFVVHVHSDIIWKYANLLIIPTTDASVEYGTPGMALEVKRIFEETNVESVRIFSMGGHCGGIVTFGKTIEEAAQTLLSYFALSIEHGYNNLTDVSPPISF